MRLLAVQSFILWIEIRKPWLYLNYALSKDLIIFRTKFVKGLLILNEWKKGNKSYEGHESWPLDCCWSSLKFCKCKDEMTIINILKLKLNTFIWSGVTLGFPFCFRHPVVEIFLDLKWKKVHKIFVANFITYCIFLLSYSLFLGNIFYRQDDNRRFGNVKILNMVRLLWISVKFLGTLFIYWSIQYRRLWYIYRCFIVNWRINK